MNHKRVTSNKDINRLLRDLLGEGWTMKIMKKHVKVYDPDGKYRLTVPCSASDYRSVKNLRQQVRKAHEAWCDDAFAETPFSLATGRDVVGGGEFDTRPGAEALPLEQHIGDDDPRGSISGTELDVVSTSQNQEMQPLLSEQCVGDVSDGPKNTLRGRRMLQYEVFHGPYLLARGAAKTASDLSIYNILYHKLGIKTQGIKWVSNFKREEWAATEFRIHLASNQLAEVATVRFCDEPTRDEDKEPKEPLFSTAQERYAFLFNMLEQSWGLNAASVLQYSPKVGEMHGDILQTMRNRMDSILSLTQAAWVLSKPDPVPDPVVEEAPKDHCEQAKFSESLLNISAQEGADGMMEIKVVLKPGFLQSILSNFIRG